MEDNYMEEEKPMGKLQMDLSKEQREFVNEGLTDFYTKLRADENLAGTIVFKHDGTFLSLTFYKKDSIYIMNPDLDPVLLVLLIQNTEPTLETFIEVIIQLLCKRLFELDNKEEKETLN